VALDQLGTGFVYLGCDVLFFFVGWKGKKSLTRDVVLLGHNDPLVLGYSRIQPDGSHFEVLHDFEGPEEGLIVNSLIVSPMEHSMEAPSAK